MKREELFDRIRHGIRRRARGSRVVHALGAAARFHALRDLPHRARRRDLGADALAQALRGETCLRTLQRVRLRLAVAVRGGAAAVGHQVADGQPQRRRDGPDATTRVAPHQRPAVVANDFAMPC